MRCSSSRPAPTRSWRRRPASGPPRRRSSAPARPSAWTPPSAREHFRAAIAAARPQERLQLRRMAEASLALAERRAGRPEGRHREARRHPADQPPAADAARDGRDRAAARAPACRAGSAASLIVLLAIVLVHRARLGDREADRAAVRRRTRQHGLVLRLPAGASSCSACWPSSGAGASARRGRRPPSNAPPRSAASGSSQFRRARTLRWACCHRSGPSSRPTATSCSPTRAGWRATSRPRTSCRTRCCARCGPIPRLRHADHLRAWLYRVTTTAAIDHHRARRREVVDRRPARRSPRYDAYDDGAFEA